MQTITAQEVFSHMAPSTLVDFIINLPDSGETSAELYDMAYRTLVRIVGTKDADAMLTENEGD